MLNSNPIECPAFLLDNASALPPVPTAVVNAGTSLAMESARLAHEQGLITPVLVGDKQQIQTIAQDLGWNISSITVVDTLDETAAAEAAVSLARHNEVHSLMKGDIHTDTLLRAVLNKETGLRTGSRLSHVFHMSVPNSEQTLCITDAVINVLPNLDTKLDIARNATSLLHAMGNKNPNIALLSATEVPTQAMPSSLEAEEIAKQAAAGAIPGATVDGPLALDNAVSDEAAKIKGIKSAVAGNADVLLVPNIEAGNIAFKLMVYLMGATAAGVVLGAKVPVVLTSRADAVAARLASTALASIYAANSVT